MVSGNRTSFPKQQITNFGIGEGIDIQYLRQFNNRQKKKHVRIQILKTKPQDTITMPEIITLLSSLSPLLSRTQLNQLVLINTFANIKICCFGNEVRFPETYIRVSGNPLRAMNETNIQLAMVLITMKLYLIYFSN